MLKILNLHIQINQHKLRELTTHLNALNPIAILERGYSITRTVADGHVITDPDKVAINENVHVMIAKGNLTCRIERK